jgi:hypothetical protein
MPDETDLAALDDGLTAPVAPEPISTPESDYQESEAKVWNGRVLRPWSWDVKLGANLLEMRYGAFTLSDVEQLQTTGNYPGILRDVMIFLYLSSCPDKELSQLISSPARYKAEATRKMMDFAKKEKLEPGSESFYEASLLLFEAFARDAKNQFRVEEGSKTSKDPTPGNS